jgi:hypothetical protein
MKQAASRNLLKAETCSSETSVDFRRTTLRYIPEDRTIHNHRSESLKPNILVKLYVYSCFVVEGTDFKSWPG